MHSLLLRHWKPKKSVPVLTGLSLALLLSTACSPQQRTDTALVAGDHVNLPSVEALLAADDTSAGFKGYKGIALSPEQMHASAKKQVNPGKTSGRLAYTLNPKKGDILAQDHARVLTLQTPAGAAADEFMIAELTMPKAPAFLIPLPAQKPITADDLLSAPTQIAQADTAIEPKHPIPAPARRGERVVASLSPVEDSENIVSLRTGEYQDKTRLVLDLNVAAKYDYDMSASKNVLTVHIDGDGWTLKEEAAFDDHPLIKSYHMARDSNNDTTLQFELKKPARMLMSGTVDPDQKRGHRIFFDVAAL